MRATDNSPGGWLQEQLERRKMSARSIADELGVTPKTVYDWLREKARPKDEHADKLAKLLGLDVIDVRRRFGMWVPPDESEARPEVTRAERERHADELERLARELLREVQQMRRPDDDGVSETKRRG